MIERLKINDILSVQDFITQTKDIYQDFYITKNKERKFLNDWNLLRKILIHQEVYGLNNNGLKGLLIIYREKNFRPYVKILVECEKYAKQLLIYLSWNFSPLELYCKLKKGNRLINSFKQSNFIFIGDRGSEVLLVKKALKQTKNFIPKDLLGENDADSYRQS